MTTTHATLDAGAGRRPGNPIAKPLAAFLRWMDRRTARRALHGMEDFMLRDIGISRCQIEPAIRGQLRSRRPR